MEMESTEARSSTVRGKRPPSATLSSNGDGTHGGKTTRRAVSALRQPFFFSSFLTFFVAAIIFPSVLLCRRDPSFSFLATSRAGELRGEASSPSRRGSSAMGKSIYGEQTTKKDRWANEEVSS